MGYLSSRSQLQESVEGPLDGKALRLISDECRQAREERAIDPQTRKIAEYDQGRYIHNVQAMLVLETQLNASPGIALRFLKSESMVGITSVGVEAASPRGSCSLFRWKSLEKNLTIKCLRFGEWVHSKGTEMIAHVLTRAHKAPIRIRECKLSQ